MIEVSVNLWSRLPAARVITTNGAVRSDGRCVMGRGCAAEAASRFPDLPMILGQSLVHEGLAVRVFDLWDRTEHNGVAIGRTHLIAFPVKHHWRHAADLELIERSAHQLVKVADARQFRSVLMPRPGCGNGRRAWREVRGILAPILDDRFFVTHVPNSRR